MLQQDSSTLSSGLLYAQQQAQSSTLSHEPQCSSAQAAACTFHALLHSRHSLAVRANVLLNTPESGLKLGKQVQQVKQGASDADGRGLKAEAHGLRSCMTLPRDPTTTAATLRSQRSRQGT